MAGSKSLDGQMLAEAIGLEDAGEALEMVRGLLGSGVDVNAAGINGWNALTEALWAGRWEIVRLLLEHGVCRGGGDFRGYHDPILGLAFEGPMNLLVSVLERCGGWECILDHEFAPVPVLYDHPISMLIEEGSYDRLEALWKSGISMFLETPSYDFGRTPIAEAANAGNLTGVRWLLAKGANTNAHAEYCDSYTALDCAVNNLDVEMVQLLLEAGANPSFLHGNSLPLHNVSISPFDAGQTQVKIAKGRQIYEWMLKKANDFPPPVGQDGKAIKPWPPKL